MSANFWKRKLLAYLHDPPKKFLDHGWHQQRAENCEKVLAVEDAQFRCDRDHTASAGPFPGRGIAIL